MPNSFAFLILAAWPLISIALFRKLSIGRAVIWSLLLSYLFLPPPPTAFDFPLMPPLSKQTLPSVTAFLICWFLYGRGLMFLPKSKVVRGLMIVFVVSPMATILTNGEPVFFGVVGLPALRITEGFALMVQQSMLLMPFILARNFLTLRADHRDLLVAFVFAGLVYSLFMLVEVRLSPQMNVWIYGFFQHSFEQMVRSGGFRPIVFLYHGLWVAFFAMMVLVAAAALYRAENGRTSTFYLGVTGYMGIVLFLCKSLASFGYAAVAVPLVMFSGRRAQFRLAALLAFLAIAYPVMKGVDLIPKDFLLQQAERIDPQRSASLKFRFDNEEILLERAYKKPIFGWGSWGRNHILDPVSGRILTVTDGRWIIVIGVFGWVGFLAEFCLLAWPIFMLLARSKEPKISGSLRGDDKPKPSDGPGMSPFVGPMALMLAFNLFDLLPNATITSLTFLLSGALLGYVEERVSVPSRKKIRLRSIM